MVFGSIKPTFSIDSKQQLGGPCHMNTYTAYLFAKSRKWQAEGPTTNNGYVKIFTTDLIL